MRKKIRVIYSILLLFIAMTGCCYLGYRIHLSTKKSEGLIQLNNIVDIVTPRRVESNQRYYSSMNIGDTYYMAFFVKPEDLKYDLIEFDLKYNNAVSIDNRELLKKFKDRITIKDNHYEIKVDKKDIDPKNGFYSGKINITLLTLEYMEISITNIRIHGEDGLIYTTKDYNANEYFEDYYFAKNKDGEYYYSTYKEEGVEYIYKHHCDGFCSVNIQDNFIIIRTTYVNEEYFDLLFLDFSSGKAVERGKATASDYLIYRDKIVWKENNKIKVFSTASGVNEEVKIFNSRMYYTYKNNIFTGFDDGTYYPEDVEDVFIIASNDTDNCEITPWSGKPLCKTMGLYSVKNSKWIIPESKDVYISDEMIYLNDEPSIRTTIVERNPETLKENFEFYDGKGNKMDLVNYLNDKNTYQILSFTDRYENDMYYIYNPKDKSLIPGINASIVPGKILGLNHDAIGYIDNDYYYHLIDSQTGESLKYYDGKNIWYFTPGGYVENYIRDGEQYIRLMDYNDELLIDFYDTKYDTGSFKDIHSYIDMDENELFICDILDCSSNGNECEHKCAIVDLKTKNYEIK